MTEQNESIFTICVRRKSEKGFYRLQTIWNENYLKIYLLDDQKAYNSTVHKNELSNEANILDMKYEMYIEKLITGLQNDYNDSYYYERRENIFLIYRQQGVSMQVKLIQFNLEEINYMKTVENFIDKLRTISTFYKEKLEVLETEKNNLLKEKTSALQDLEKFIFLKDKSENDLYSNFIILLNEKKKRIAYLMDLIARYKNGEANTETNSESEEINPIMKKNNKNKIISENKIEITKRIETISDSGSDTEIDENFEKSMQKQSDPGPSKRKYDLLNDDESLSISLPKRAAQTCDGVLKNFNIFTSNKVEETELHINSDRESQDLEEIFASNELILQKSLSEKVTSQNSTESPNFHTQDLLDRL